MTTISTNRILGVISEGTKNTRYLIFGNDNKFHSVLLPNGTDIENAKIDEEKFDAKPIKYEWIRRGLHSLQTNFKKEIFSHLETYKKDRLHIPENGVWKANGKSYPHILRNYDILENLIHKDYYGNLKKEFVKLYDKRDESGKHTTGIHPYFSHLNSSQALTLNFFVPLICENKLDILQELSLQKIDSCEFEKKGEDGTQFDFCIVSGGKIYSFEVKYSEPDFAPAKIKTEKYNRKWQEIYEPELKKHGISISQEEFFKEYQLWRNIFYALKNKNHTTCFVFPKFRIDLDCAVEFAKSKCPKDVQERIKIIFIDDVVEKMRKSDSPKLKSHYDEFFEKYLKDFEERFTETLNRKS